MEKDVNAYIAELGKVYRELKDVAGSSSHNDEYKTKAKHAVKGIECILARILTGANVAPNGRMVALTHEEYGLDVYEATCEVVYRSDLHPIICPHQEQADLNVGDSPTAIILYLK